MKLTSEEYAATGGVKCPACLSEDIEGGVIEIDAGYASQACQCHNCNETWHDSYQLIGYVEI